MSADLCTQCGLCCDGTLFGGVRLDEAEARDAARLRLPVLRGDDGPALRFPCSAYQGLCTIYEERPTTCRAYRCELYSRLEAGEIDLAAAAARVRRVKELVASIRARLPGHEGGWMWAEIQRLGEAPAAWKRENEELLLDIVTLRQTLLRFIDARSGLAGATPRAR